MLTSIGFCLILSFCKYSLIVYQVPGTVHYFPSLPAQQDRGKKHKFMAMVMLPMAICSFRTSWSLSQAPVEGSRTLEPTGSKICNDF